MKTLMIFGGLGFVGSKLAKIACERGWTVGLADNKPGTETYTGIAGDVVDITDIEQVKRYILDKKPDAIVNVAAISNIDVCEKNKELALLINAVAPKNIAGCAKQINAKYVFFSSDAVFDGKADGYSEDSATNPLNYYGQTKLLAEDWVLNANENACIVRISLIIGFSSVEGNSYLSMLSKKLENLENVYFSTDEIRTPIMVDTLCECVLELIEIDYKGIIHIASTDSIDKYSLAQNAAVHMGFDPSLVRPSKTDDNDQRAPRHKKGILLVNKAKGLLKTELSDVETELRQIFNNR